ncbi:MAG: neutral/alkaline non-lysosomal ceramidase N-terminal domain-containing protein [Planctomycetota bacterium]
MLRTCLPVLCLVVLHLGTRPVCTCAAEGLCAGAARIDITPSEKTPVPMSGFGGRKSPFTKIHDRLYYRVIVVENEHDRAAIVVGDVLSISNDFWGRVTEKIAQETGIPQDNILLCATHTHGAPSAEYRETDAIIDKILTGVDQARKNLQPAAVGAAKGYCNVNICRRARTATGNARGGWWLGQNPDGPADKTMHVIKFETLEGEPIAVLVNYAAHGTTMGQDNTQITGDHPGACCRFVEEHFGSDIVVAWTSGAAGDLDPIYAYRTDFGGRISPVSVLGRIQGEEVIRLVEEIETTRQVRISGQQTVVTVPGRKNLSGKSFRPKGDYEFVDAEPMDIRLAVLQIGRIALCGVSGEVLTLVGQRLKQQSPLSHTIMVTHANGSSGYIPNDEAYEKIGYEILVTRVKLGAEKVVIDGLLRMLERLQQENENVEIPANEE